MIIKKKKRIIMLSVVATVFVVLVLWIVWGNTALELNTYTVKSNKIPDAFSGYRIAQISDLHNAEMGENNKDLLLILKEANPDIIAITGDLIDSRNTNIEIALDFAAEAVKIAPCYYVTGNHEARVVNSNILFDGLKELGVTVLEDEKTTLEKDGEYITLIGVNDTSYKTDYLFGDDADILSETLEKIQGESDGYMILLSHRPELFEVYVKSEINLVLSGHAHGGQFRLPFVGGLVAPNQGLFPKYDSGLYADGNTNMVVSRGIGNSIIPFRFNNRPEVVLIEFA